MLKCVGRFIKNDFLLFAAALLALASALIVPPDTEYIGYLNLPVLALLFCLMAVVAGLRKAGVFDWLSAAAAGRLKSERGLAAALVAVCFFSSMLITNDVALITFVPFTIQLMRKRSEKKLIFVVVMETIAANLGSLVTPIGNPQNLFLYTYYDMEIGQFFRITLPLGGICLLLIAAILLFFKGGGLDAETEPGQSAVKPSALAVFGALFILCLLTVLRILPYYVCLAAVLIGLFVYDRSVFARVDYVLLATFVCFFVFVGNMARLEAVKAIAAKLLSGRELLVGALLSQIISNVPAAAMLASFTDDAKALILGVNIGGLGTLIASMASLISYRFYCLRPRPAKARYFAVFSAYNFALLAALLVIARTMLL